MMLFSDTRPILQEDYLERGITNINGSTKNICYGWVSGESQTTVTWLVARGSHSSIYCPDDRIVLAKPGRFSANAVHAYLRIEHDRVVHSQCRISYYQLELSKAARLARYRPRQHLCTDCRNLHAAVLQHPDRLGARNHSNRHLAARSLRYQSIHFHVKIFAPDLNRALH